MWQWWYGIGWSTYQENVSADHHPDLPTDLVDKVDHVRSGGGRTCQDQELRTETQRKEGGRGGGKD